MAKSKTAARNKTASARILDELKIIKAKTRNLEGENRSTRMAVMVLKDKLEDESALIQEKNLEFKDEILGETKAIREELAVALG